MCGIIGEAGNRQFIEPNEKTVLRMANTITHRGPDEYGHFEITAKEWAVNLGVRRLAIIDRSGGHQPMHCGKVDLVFNGEIFNHRRLRTTFRDMPFKTDCDTEIIGRLWDREGPACVDQLEGMFAAAIWDRGRKALYLVRDRLGKKPLYYAWDESRNVLVFGSEIKALLAHPMISREVNPEGLFHYLSLQYVPEPMTAYKGIMCVPPGGMVVYRPAEGKLAVQKWYELKPWDAAPGTSSEVGTEAVRETVREAILSRLESEVPLGVYLSGGVDSSIVAAVAREGCKELHTFAMGFKEDAYNECPFARQVATRLGTIHHEALVELPQLPEMTERVVNQYDQPFGDCSAIPTMLLAQESKKYITVALTGDGGDEAFGGYERYIQANPEHAIPGYLAWMAVIPFAIRDRMLDPMFKQSLLDAPHTRGWMLREAFTYPGADVRNQMAWLDVRTYLLNDIIVKMERATMASSVEARCPFLDRRVMELGMAIPSNLKIEGGVGKLILKEAFKGVLPLSVILRKKQGFGVPVNEWFRAETGKQMLREMVTDTKWPWGILRADVVAAMIESHLNGTATIGHAIYVIYMLHAWLRRNFA